VKLGDRAVDAATGFAGIVTARAEYLEASPQVRITAETGPAGDLKERWIDEGRVQEQPRSPGFGLGAREGVDA
jgi:hypothetical protein